MPVSALVIALLGWVLAADAQSRGQADREVAVTIDDLPAVSPRGLEAQEAITRDLLASLGQHGVPAIGFVNERNLYERGGLSERRVALLERWLDAGLELGNHTFSHPDLHRTPLAEYQADILRGERITRALLERRGRPLRYFRHPMLHAGRDHETKRRLAEFLDEHRYRIAPVTIDNSEWIFARAYERAIVTADTALRARIAADYLEYMDTVFGFYEAQSRALLGREVRQTLLLHANQLNADLFDRLAVMMRRRGYRFVSLERALEDEAYRRPDAYTGPAGVTWLHRWALAEGRSGAFFRGEPEVPDYVSALAEIRRD